MANMVFTYPLPDPVAMINKIVAAGGPRIQNTTTGQVNEDGIVIQWNIDRRAGTITLTVVKKPFYISAAKVTEELDSFFKPPVTAPEPEPIA